MPLMNFKEEFNQKQSKQLWRFNLSFYIKLACKDPDIKKLLKCNYNFIKTVIKKNDK